MVRWSDGYVKSPFLLMNLLAAVYWFDEALQAELLDQGAEPVTRAQSLVLMNLAIGETRPARIARNLGVTRQAISQLLAQMQQRNLVVIRQDPADRRAQIVEHNEVFSGLRSTAQRILAEIEIVLGERIGNERLNNLREALSVDWGRPPYTKSR